MGIPRDFDSQTRQFWVAAYFGRHAKDHDQRNALALLRHLAAAGHPAISERAIALVAHVDQAAVLFAT